MHIGIPQIASSGGEVTWSVAVTGLSEAPDRLWFSVPERDAGMVTNLTDPAVIGLLVPAMHARAPITVGGPVTDELSHNIRHGYQQVLHKVIGGRIELSPVAVETPNAVRVGQAARGVATGFSAGVDSYSVIVDHYFSSIVPPHLRLTHLTYFNVGSHGPFFNAAPSERSRLGRHIFRTRFNRLEPIAATMGLPIVPVDSNLDDFYPFTGYQQTMGPRIFAAASLLQEEIGRYYLASSYPYDKIGVTPSPSTEYSDPVSLPLLSTEHFRIYPHGHEYTRVEKTQLIASAPICSGSLDVCIDPLPDGSNCSQCFKCLRTQLTLEIAGKLDAFASVFNLEIYGQSRTTYLDEVVLSNDEFAVEICGFAREMDFQLPGSVSAELRRRQSQGVLRRAAWWTLKATGTLGPARKTIAIVRGAQKASGPS